nr:Biomphalaria glabrata toll-like receptor 13 [Biomphalaria glabrata]
MMRQLEAILSQMLINTFSPATSSAPWMCTGSPRIHLDKLLFKRSEIFGSGQIIKTIE